MAQSGAYHHTQYGNGGIRAAFAGQYQLTQRATAQQDGTPADQGHAQGIPQTIGVGNRLTLKAQVKVAGDEVADDDSDDNSDKAI